MAGTRLAIIATYIVQFTLLFGTAVYLANNSESSLFGIYGGSIFVNRRGIGILKSSDGNGNSDGDLSSLVSHRLVELRKRVEMVRYPVDFRVSPVVIGGQDYRLVEPLRSGLDSIVGLDKKYDVRVSEASRARSNSGTCDDLSSRFGTASEDEPTTRRETSGYDIVTVTGCTDVSIPIGHDTKLSVDDFGDMLLSIRGGVSEEDISSIVRDHVAGFIADEFLNHGDAAKPSWVESTSALEVVVTLLDEDLSPTLHHATPFRPHPTNNMGTPATKPKSSRPFPLSYPHTSIRCCNPASHPSSTPYTWEHRACPTKPTTTTTTTTTKNAQEIENHPYRPSPPRKTMRTSSIWIGPGTLS